jgi:hypothetical protein
MGQLVFQATLGGAVNLIGPNIAGTVNFTLPSADGTSGQALSTNGTGTLAFSSFATLVSNTFTGSQTLSGGTANGVTYLNGSKVLTSGSALVFDGTNLGVGTASPANVLNVKSATQYKGIQVNNATNTIAELIGFNAVNEAGGLKLYNAGNPIVQLISDGNSFINGGNLGIGTSSPQLKFVVSNAGAQGFEVNPNSGIISGGIDILCYNRSAAAYKPIYTNAEYHVWATSTTERARIDSSGNLGLGVTPAASVTIKGLQAGNAMFAGVNGGSYATANAYFDGANWKYITSNFATLYQQSSSGGTGQHAWSYVASGTAGNAITFTQAMTLDASGNLGVGTTSPSYRLDASASAGNGSFVTQITNSNTGSDGRGILRLRGYNGAQVNTLDFAGGRYFGANDDSLAVINNAAAGGITFNIGGVSNGTQNEAMRIDSSKNLLVGITSGTYHILFKNHADFAAAVQNGNANPYGLAIRYSGAAPNGAVNNFLEMYDTSVTRAKFLSNGGLANYSANNSNLSDRREKTNFAPAGSYLDKICAIPVQTFNYIDQNLEEDGGLTLGVVAQDVQAVAPELVMESNWASKDETPKMRLSIYQTDLQYALMKCIQEQQALIQSLKARLDAANL